MQSARGTPPSEGRSAMLRMLRRRRTSACRLASRLHGGSCTAMTGLILKRGDPSRRRDNDYDVLEDGKVVGRIFHLEAAAPEGRPWMWASGHARLRWQRS